MSASDELPRGLTLFSSPGLGGNATVTFPAIAGIAWVIDEIYLSAYNVSTTTAYGSGISVTPSGYINVGSSGVLSVQGNSQASAFGDWTYPGKPVTFPVGSAVTIAPNSNGISFTQLTLIAHGYPI